MWSILFSWLSLTPLENYHFTSSSKGSQRLSSHFEPPLGYERIPLAKGSFGQWLRDIPLSEGTQVLSHRGEAIAAPAAAVVPLDVGQGDLQQCADSILRLYAEYRWSVDQGDNLGFHFSSGDLSSWRKWRNGERFSIRGSTVKRIRRSAVSNTHAQYRKWLQHTFIYAGTRSLNRDSTRLPVDKPIVPGDFFVSPGSPGHAIIVLDVAKAPGQPDVALLGQGFMPAQSFHVIEDDGSHMRGRWFVLPSGQSGALKNPSWSKLPRSGVFRFPKTKP